MRVKRSRLRAFLVLAATLPLAAQDGMPPALVAVAPVTREAVGREVVLPGSAVPAMDSLVAAEVEGRVAQRRVEAGDRVAKGQELVRLDATRLERQLQVARADRADVGAQLELARVQERRADELSDHQLIAPEELDEARSRRESLEGRLQAIEARLAATEEDVVRTRIRAPFAGIVTELHTEVGQWIARGDPAVRLSKLDPIDISVDVPERHFPLIAVGDEVTAVVDALGGLELRGRVHTRVPRVRSAARSFPVTVRVDNPDGRLGAGMLCRVAFKLGEAETSLTVPRDALVRQASGLIVYVVEDGAARLVPVTGGRAQGDRVAVAGELSEGELVVVRGNERLVPGQPVRVAE